MAQGLSASYARRYRILSILCVLILVLLLSCLNSSSWRTIETADVKRVTQFYPPLHYHPLACVANRLNRTFQLQIGPLWRCLTIVRSGDKQAIVARQCTANEDSFDYTILCIGLISFICYTLLSISLISYECCTFSLNIVRLCMSFILELATLWLVYGVFHVQRAFGPLHGWASIGFSIGMLSVLIVCVLEWDDYFRHVCNAPASTIDGNKQQRLNVWLSTIRHSDRV